MTGPCNFILEEVAAPTREAIQSQLRPHCLPAGVVLFDVGDTLRHVWFPTSGVVSLHSTTADGDSIGMTAVGSEGLVGISLALGFNRAPCRAVVQVEGSAWRLDARSFSHALRTHADLHAAVMARTRRLMLQLIQSTTCSRFHSAEQRLARCLLETADRADAQTLSLTHDVLALILGMRRPWVTRTIARLRYRGCIELWRGKIVIIDRAALGRIACECYWSVRSGQTRS